MDWLEIVGIIANIIGIVTAIFSVSIWIKTRWIQQEMQEEKERKNRRITVRLQHGTRSYELPVDLRRAELTRSEIMGRLGMIPMKDKSKRFDLPYTNDPEFLRRINEIIDGKGDSVLTIPCLEEEFDQFDIIPSAT